MPLVAIDPGFGGTGVCTLDAKGQLASVALIVPCGPSVTFAERLLNAASSIPIHVGASDEVIIEFPQTYAGRSAKGDTDDLLKLSALIGAYVVYACAEAFSVSFVLPGEWKGQVPKEVHHPRIIEALSAKEVANLDRYRQTVSASLFHNVLDAVGIAKWRYANPKFQSRFGSSSVAVNSVRAKIKALRSGK